MTRSGDPEQRLAEALRAQARGGARPSVPPRGATRSPVPAWLALLLVLLAGGVLGTALALLSLLVPGVLPALG